MSEPARANTSADLRAAITRLAQFRPFGAGRAQVDEVLRRLVLATAYEAGEPGLSSLAECREYCRALWGIEIELDEVRRMVQELCRQGKLRKSGGAYLLTRSGRHEQAELVAGNNEIKAEAFAAWETAVRGLDSSIEPELMETLRGDLDLWLQQIVVRHGVEATMILYPEDARGSQLLGEIERQGLDFLPEREEPLHTLRPQALYLFIHQPTPPQRAYLANLMTTAFMAASFTLDPRAAARIQELTAGQWAYLDTNVVYDALNLNGPQRFMSMRRILELTRSLGYRLAVTQWTVTEMKESLRRSRKDLAKTRLPPRALAELAAEASGEESFVTAYWRKYKATGVSVEDFTAMYKELEPLIEKLGIEITDAGCLAVDRNEAAIDEQVFLIEQIPGGEFKNEPVKVHDVKHRLLIERLRGDGNRRFSNAGYWFLTRDSVLVPYGRARRAHDDMLPFAISTTAWAQIVRSFTPRTEDFEQTLVDLLDTPAMRPKGAGPVSYEAVAEVLGRVDLMVSDSSEEIASRVLLNQAEMAEIDRTSGRKREAKIDQAIKTKTDEMRRQLHEAEDAQAAAERASASLTAELDQERQAVARLGDRVKTEQEARERAEAELQQLTAAKDEDARTAREQFEDTQRQHTHELAALRLRLDRMQKIGRIGIGVIVVAAAIAVGIVPLLAGLVTDGLDWALIIGGAGGIALGGLWLLIGLKRAALAATITVTAVGFISAVYGFAPRDTPSAPRHAPGR